MTDGTRETDAEAQSTNTSLPDISRRRVLQGAAAAGAVGMLSGVVSAQETSSEEYIVGLEPQGSVTAVRSQADSVHRVLDFGSIGTAVVGQFSDGALANFANRSDVRYIEPNKEGKFIAETLPWGVDRVDADKVHTNNKTGEGSDIVIIDTGIDKDHPDLEANLGKGKSFVEYTDKWGEPVIGHGTHCAGIADAIDNTEGVIGVSTEATLHAARVDNKLGTLYADDVAEALTWTADNNYSIASMSFNFRTSPNVLKDACNYAEMNGVLLVAAAGNAGPEPKTVHPPATYKSVIAVSATDKNDNLAEFSSRGPAVELAAPGVKILSTLPEEVAGTSYGKYSGTSMSCPHVAGAGGLLMANGFTNKEARQRLQDTAEDIGLPEKQQGHGLLDVEAAVPDQQSLRIEGTGKYAFYTFTASGNVTITEDDREDKVDGSTASGAVGAESDSYTFKGSLDNFFLSGDAKVFVNDEQINPSDYPSSLHAITFKGKGSYATYKFSVSESIVDGRGLDQEDSISGNHAEGAVGPGQELYVYTGKLTNLNTDNDVKVIKGDVTSITGNSVNTTNEEEVEENDV